MKKSAWRECAARQDGLSRGKHRSLMRYTVVLAGMLRVTHTGGEMEVAAGQAVITRAGEWVKYSTPKSRGSRIYRDLSAGVFADDRAPGLSQPKIRRSVVMLRLIGLIFGVIEGFAMTVGAQGIGTPLAAATNQTAPADSQVLFPAFEVRDENERSLPLFSVKAYRAEFLHLHKAFHKIDLTGPAVKTDGWTYNISEAEWPFMGFCYFGYACANFAKYDPVIREEALVEMRWLIEALQTPRMSGFETPHFGEPFGTNGIHVAVFVHGHFLNLAMRYREVSGDNRYDALIHRVAAALVREYAVSDQGILRSYKDMWWITAQLSGPVRFLSRYDRIFRSDTSAAREKFLHSLKTYYLDKDTGMFCTYVNPVNHTQLQGPRGISMMYGLHFLKDFDDKFAANQYDLAKSFLVQNMLGFSAVREFPKGTSGRADVDSGPLILGTGPSASGFAIAAAAINGDEATAGQLLKASAMAGMPVLREGELEYLSIPVVGQAVILFGMTELLKSK